MSFPMTSKPPRGYRATSTFNPAQQQGFQQLIQQLMGAQGQQTNVGQNPAFQGGQNFLQQLLSGGQGAFEQFEAPYKRQFNEETVPGLATLFAGLGAGSQSSGAFQRALGQAGSGLSENLANLRGQLQLHALPQAQQYAQQPFQNLLSLLGINSQALLPKTPTFLQQLGTYISGNASKGLGFLSGGGSK